MKHVFLLDENVIAQTKSEPLAKQTTELIRLITLNCHKIALDLTLNGKLTNWLKRRDSAYSRVDPLGPVALTAMLTNSGKRIWVKSEEAEERKYIRHTNDHYLVDIAVTLKNVHFVSTGDSRTRNDFNKPQLKAHGIDGLTVAGAIELAKDK